MKTITLFRAALTALLFTLFLVPFTTNAQTCGTTIAAYPYGESFEGAGAGGLGAWIQDATDGGNWTVATGGPFSGGTGPQGASHLNYYIYTEASTGQNPGNPNVTAFLNSPCFNLAGLSNPEFTFDYHMYGGQMGTLKVQVSTNNGTSWADIGWTRTGQQNSPSTSPWLAATINLTAYAGLTIKLRFHGTTGSGYQSDMAVDNVGLQDNVVTCTSTVNTFPYTEGFEGAGAGGLGAWIQDATDGGDWTIATGGPFSGGTGPQGAAELSYYAYTEASSGQNPGNPNVTAFLNSPCFDLTGLSNPDFNFSYHMYGASMGTLKVQVSTDNGATFTDIGWTRTGQQHAPSTAPWLTATINLAAYVGQTIVLRFHGTTGGGYQSDMAIDGISLVDTTPLPEINITGLGNNILDGDTTPDVADDTEFGNVDITGFTAVHTFTIENTGTGPLSLTGASPYAILSGANAGDFTVNVIPANSIAASANTTFQITFDPSALGLRTATVTIANDDSDENPYTFNIQGTGTTTIPEIDIIGNAVSITDGDTTPAVADDTDFGDNVAGFGSTVHTFTIANVGGGNLNLTDPTPFVVITGAHAADFTLGVVPTTPVVSGINTTFTITFAPSALGIRTATVSIANNDSDENPYNFDIQGNGTGSAPEINITGNGFDIVDGDITPISADNTDFGNVILLGSLENVFTIENTGSLPLTLAGASPFVTITGANAGDFTVTAIPANPVLTTSSTTFNITFTPSALGLRTATISISSDDSDESPYTFDIQGNGANTISIGPGGINTDLQLWLKANDGAGSTDGQALSTWSDQAFSNDATVNTAGQEPTWRDNVNTNVNFNPVVDFDNSFSTFNNDGNDYTPLPQEFLEGSGGFYTDDIFFVVIPDTTIDIGFHDNGYFMDCFTGDANPGDDIDQDVTGIGFGAYSARFTDEIISYAQATETDYGVAETNTASSYDNIGIINARNNTALNGMELYYNSNLIHNVEVNAGTFTNFNDTRYWIGRSQVFRSSMDARVVEIITYSARKNNATERNRIESYLGLKYGITLGANGTSKNYFDSSSNVIWDITANSGYNYDIAGIARDDGSDFIQKQSKSINPTAVVSIGLGDVTLTNNANSNTFNADRDYLIWGHDGNAMTTAPASSDITINLGPTTVTTITQRVERNWKIVETGGDVPTVEISVLQSDLTGLPALTGNDAYVMVVADDSAFTTNVETVFLNPGTFNGAATQEITYDFDGTKYFTIGVAHETVEPRHSTFDGTNDFTLIGNTIDLTGDFSVSAWVRTTGSNATNSDKTIVAKKGLSGGYHFMIRDDNTVEFNVGSGSSNRIRSNTSINNNIWHHVAVTYSGTTANLYIDGMLDETDSMNNPSSSSESFTIGAVYESKNVISDHFEGDIDEVRLWANTLSIDEIRFIMNQEIERSAGGMVQGKVLPFTITKNDVGSRLYSNLLAYYDMNSYLGTHLNDVSDNNNRGSLVVPNNFSIELQTAPLPYISLANTDWDLSAAWINGSLYRLPGTASIVDNTLTVDWNIVQTLHNITMDNSSLPSGNSNNRTVLGLLVDSNELTVSADNGLTVTHYLNLDGSIDLVDESQLIQTDGSDLDVTSSGSLERDQQGTSDTFTYNYWASPVGTINTTANNQNYTVPNMMRDGTTPATPGALGFLTTGYNGTAAPVAVADYWIWKFANQTGNDATDYSFWQHVRSTGTLEVGEGFTMKGPGTGTILTPQNYVFTGKPNNADISLTINSGNDYLVGNPYPSALDAHEFLDDNPLTGGTLYFWEHWGGGSHLLADYQGGYAQYNYSGGTGAASYGTNDPDVGTGGTPTKLPGRYVPVAQGFFVAGSANGTINFENDQRAFVTEGTTSVFVRSANANRSTTEEIDTRMKFRIGFNSVNQIHRQLLLTVDDNASSGVDWGYDGIIKEGQIDDMYWMIGNDKYIIQGTNQVNTSTIAPLGIHTRDDGMNEIVIDKLENVADDVDVFVHDKDLGIFHDLNQGAYQVYLIAGEYTERFDIVFNNEIPSLDVDDNDLTDLFEVHYSNEEKSIVIVNPTSTQVEYLEVFNILGQSIQSFDEIPSQNITQLKATNLSTGTYIIKLSTELGTISKKVLVK